MNSSPIIPFLLVIFLFISQRGNAQSYEFYDLLEKPSNLREYQNYLKQNINLLEQLHQEVDIKYINSFMKILETSQDTKLKTQLLEEMLGEGSNFHSFMLKLFELEERKPDSFRAVEKSLLKLQTQIPKAKIKLKTPIRCTSAALIYLASRDFTHSFAASFIDLKSFTGREYSKNMEITKTLVLAFFSVGCLADINEFRTSYKNWLVMRKTSHKSKKFISDVLANIENTPQRREYLELLYSKKYFLERNGQLKAQAIAGLYADITSPEARNLSQEFDAFGSEPYRERVLKALQSAYMNLLPSEKREVLKILSKKNIEVQDLRAMQSYTDNFLEVLEKDLWAYFYSHRKLKNSVGPAEFLRESYEIEKIRLERFHKSHHPDMLSRMCNASLSLGFVYLGLGAAFGGKESELDSIGEKEFRKKFFDSLPYAGPAIAAPCIAKVLVAPEKILKTVKLNKKINREIGDLNKVRRLIVNTSKSPRDARAIYEAGDNLDEIFGKISRKLERTANFDLIHPQFSFSNQCIIKLLELPLNKLMASVEKSRSIASQDSSSCQLSMQVFNKDLSASPYAEILINEAKLLGPVKTSYLEELVSRISQVKKDLSVAQMRQLLHDLIKTCK